MNWYKKIKFSSYNLKMPPEIYPQIDNIVESILNFYRNYTGLPSSPEKIGTISFVDNYSGENISSDIYINNNFVEKDNRIPAKRDRITGNIYFNIYEIVDRYPEQINMNVLKTYLTNQLVHELSHSIDPKIKSLNKRYPNTHEYLKPTEFDAYSKELTEYIKTAYEKPENRKMIKEWLVSNSFGELFRNTNENLLNILNISQLIFDIINFWKINNPTYLRKFRQRIYNEVITNENNIQ